MVRKKWLRPYYSTYWCYIHQTWTNCSSWHDLLIPRGGLCLWPTFHASVTIIRKKCLSPYFSTYWCYIHQTCTNCSSWHDLLIPRGGLCPWPTFHASVTKTQNGYSGAPVMVPITIMSSYWKFGYFRLGNFTYFLGKYRPFFHWEWGRNSTPKQPWKNPWCGSRCVDVQMWIQVCWCTNVDPGVLIYKCGSRCVDVQMWVEVYWYTNGDPGVLMYKFWPRNYYVDPGVLMYKCGSRCVDVQMLIQVCWCTNVDPGALMFIFGCKCVNIRMWIQEYWWWNLN